MTLSSMTRQEVSPLLSLSGAVLEAQWDRVRHITLSDRCRRPVGRKNEKTAMSHFWDTHHSSLLFAGIFLSFFWLFSRSPSFYFSRGFLSNTSKPKNVRRFPGLSRAIITDNMSGSAPQIISNTVLLLISRQSLKMRYSQNKGERMRAAARTI